MTDENSLSARVLKAVYYPQCTLLEAELGTRPSQIWRAILDGRDILAQWIIRRIGNGEETDVWVQNWIPRENFKRPVTSLVPNPPSKVSDFIDPNTAEWKEGLVRTVFTPFGAEEILKIPLCTRNVTDF